MKRSCERGMSKLAWLAALVLLAMLFTHPSRASEVLPGYASSRLQAPGTSLIQSILGPTCFSMRASPLDLDCNPAFLSDEHRHSFRVEASANDQVIRLNDYREKIGEDNGAGVVNALLDHQGPTIADATSEVWYQHDWWALGYTPFRGGLATLVQNPAYPHIAADIYKESELFAKVGFSPSDDPNLHVGVQARFVDRQTFANQFDLLDVASNPGTLQFQDQKMIFLEPGLVYSFDGSWDSSLSATLTQLPVVQWGDTDPVAPIVDLGFTTSPKFVNDWIHGRLSTTTHYSGNSQITDLFARFYQAVLYSYDDHFTAAFNLGKSELGVGISGRYESVTAGIGWKTQDISPDAYQTVRVSSYLFELGLIF